MTATVAARLRELCTSPDDAVISVDLDGMEQRLSWRQVADGACRIAARLRSGDPGSERSAVVAMQATNTAAALVRLLGVLAADLPVLPLDPRMPGLERQRLLEFVAREHGPVHVLSGESDGEGDGDDAVVVERLPGPDRGGARHPVAYLLATGGSSGLPKVVAAPGPLRYDPARVPSPLLRHAGWRAGQRQLVPGALHHSGPFLSCLDGVLDRNVIVLLPVFTPELLVEQVREQRIEWLQLTPSHLRTVLQFAEPDPAAFATVRAVLHTAAACDMATKQAWLELLGPQRVFESYGSTEQVGVTLARGDEWLARPGTVGRGFMTQIRILDDAGRRLPPGEVGAVYMRTGRASRPSYLGGLPMVGTPDGFVSVGDHGWLDQDGYLFLAPRRTDLINVGGENVYPAEVEAALLEHPSVLDAMVVGSPDPMFGAVVQARVVLTAGAQPSGPELIRHCAARLAPYKVPNKISFVASVPRSAAGKLERWRSATQGDA